MLILFCLVHIILLPFIRAEPTQDEPSRFDVGDARQIFVTGRMPILTESKPLFVFLRCMIEGDELYPLVIDIDAKGITFSAQPGEDTPATFDRTFQDGLLTITISIFTDRFYLTVSESLTTTYDFKPSGWFGTDFGVGKNCEKREIVYSEKAWTIKAVPTLQFFHPAGLFPGKIVNIDGRMIEQNFDISFSDHDGKNNVPFQLSARKGKITASCGLEKITEKANLDVGPITIHIHLFDIRTEITIKNADHNVSIICHYTYPFIRIDSVFIGSVSSIVTQTPVIREMKTPVYVARYKEESTYNAYKELIDNDEKAEEYIKNTLSGGAFRYDLSISDDGKQYALVPTVPSAVGFHFVRLPYHFLQCPCDCLSDVGQVVFMEEFESINFTDTDILRTVVFHQWIQNIGIKMKTEESFLLEIFTHPTSFAHCDWTDSVIVITSIEEEYLTLEPGASYTMQFVNTSRHVDSRDIIISQRRGEFIMSAFGGPMLTLNQSITFVQAVGLKSIGYLF